MIRNSKQIAFVAITFAFCSYVSAQQIPASMMARQGADTTKKPSGPSNGLKSYKEIITTKSVTDVGFFNVHKVDSKYYFEIPEDILGRDILVVNRIAKAPAGLRSGGSFLAMAAIR
jgi:hypothetical protein